ncbi:MAG: hypothetical protein CVV42_13265 [Candidatus Riflebacteria bacterium HGW-Riflebacteria-2]|nr:MAG: hypothetical protein CVV42_13265 [Candidatus Riflebacteria bacterium HGW-Riflebacteria-2]
MFAGTARDYLNTVISSDSWSWYVATDTQPFALGQTGGATFTWQFLAQGSYTVALQVYDANGVIGTGSKNITIINGRPVCVITQPLNDASFLPNTPVTFIGSAEDLEDGTIIDATKLIWTSDIDGVIGSGIAFAVASLTSSRHEINFAATDSGGAIGSTSIVIWYDVPARISFTPINLTVFFEGYNIPFAAVGTDTDNTPLDSTQFKWYFDNLPDIWRDGASFSVTAGAYVPGAHSVRVEGPSKYGTAVSPTHSIQMGWPIASITSPASGTRFEPLDVVTFTATPDSTGTLTLSWYLNNDIASFGSGSIVNYAPPNGAHKVTYVGSDSQGIISSSTISIVVERIPIVSFFPITGSYLFTGRPVEFDATCLDSDNNDIADNRVSWLKDGAAWPEASGKSFSVTQPAQLPSGTYNITLIATGPYGTAGAITNTINAGIPVAKIITPANNQTFSSGTNINFTGVPDSIPPIVMEWWSNFGLPGAAKLGEGASINNNTLPDGYHYISYLGTDSAGFVSSNTVRIGIGEFPVMDFTPDAGTVFFSRQDVVFTGVGTDSIDGTLTGNSMAWYIDGVLELASYSVMTITTARMATLGTGLKDVELRGYNGLGAAGSTVKKIYLGVPNAVITAPLNDAVIPTASLYTFTATPDSVTGAEITDDLIMEWWLNPGSTKIGEGQSIPYTLPDGMQFLTYIGTDSQGIVSSATIRVIVSNSPAISFTPANGAQLFFGQPFNLVIGGAVEPASVKWSLDGGATTWKSVSPATVAAGELPVGASNITAEGENLLGVAASITNTITYGIDLASITAPASGSVYPISAPLNEVDFSAVPVPSPPYINMRWYRDDGGGAVFMGDSASLANYAMPPGRHTITYVGTDSANFLSSSSIQILINDPPPLEINPGNNSIFFAGRTVTFTGSGTSVISGLPVAGSTMKWTISGGTDITATSTPSYGILNQPPLYPSVRSLTLQGTDDLGTSNTFGPINVAFGYPVASITFPASGTRYDLASSITFIGSDDSGISMSWYRDAEVVPFQTGANPPPQTGWPAGIRTIRYEGTDASGFTSSATIQILINDKPSVAVLLPVLSPPGNNLVFYSGRPVNFTATGTTASGNNVATFSWYINGSAVANYTGLSITIPANTLSVAGSPHSIRLEATDEYEVKKDITVSIYFSSLPVITEPTPGNRYATGTSVLFEGTPAPFMPNLDMRWFYGDPLLVPMGAGDSINFSLPYGLQKVTYLATDSSGFVGSASIQVLMNDIPRPLITPPTGAIFFGGRSVTIYGSGSDTVDASLNSANFKWYVDGALKPLLTGQQNPVFGVVELTPGLHEVALSATDGYGTAGTATSWLTFRHGVASISAPASGTMWDHDLSVDLLGSPDSQLSINMLWLADGVPTGLTDAGPHPYAGLNRGWNTITYVGTDSANFCSSATVMILGNRPPTMDFTPAGTPIFFTGRPVALNGFGTNAVGGAILAPDISWSVNAYSSTGATANINAVFFNNGINAVTISGTDEYSTLGSKTRNIYYGWAVASITEPASGTVYSSFANSVVCAGVPAPSLPEIDPIWHLDTVYAGSGSGITFTNLPLGVHTITYLASDSSGFVSSSTIQITVNDTPALEILPQFVVTTASPFYFAGQTASLIGSGTSQAGFVINPLNNMKWYVNGGAQIATGSPADLSANLVVGLNSVRMSATDTLNAYAETTTSVRFAEPALTIDYPASGSTLTVATLASFTGSASPAAPHNFIPDWYDVTGAPVLLGSGNSITNIPLAAGWHTIRYLATDSSGFVSSATIMVLKNDEPYLDITPGNNSIFFVGRPIDLEASGTSNPGGVTVATFSWYVNSLLRGTGPNITLDILWLNNGNNTVTIAGTDDFGTVGTYSQNIHYGYAMPAISQPASGDVFLSTDNINFVADPAAMLGATPEWWINGVKASTLSSFVSPPLATGVKLIEYIATDSSFATTGFIGSSTINIRVSTIPQMTFTPASNSYFFAGHDVTFTGLGTSSTGLAILPGDMSWYLNGSAIPTLNSPALILAASFNPGVNTMVLRGVDAYGTVGEVTGNNLFFGVPTVSITSPSMNDQFPSPNPNVSFVGSPDLSTYGLTAAWYHISGTGFDLVTPIDTGSSASKIFADGWHTIRYVASDSAGTISSATVTILVNNAPTVNFTTPASNSVFFAGGDFTLESIPIVLSNYKWYSDAGALLKTGAPATVFGGDLTVGTHTLYVSAVDGFGTVGTSTVKAIYYGHPLLTISSPPASGTQISSTDPVVNLTATLASSAISLSWEIDGVPEAGENTNVLADIYPRLSDGWNTITYIGTDSANNMSSHSIMLLKNDKPTMQIIPGNGSRFFANTTFGFLGSGTSYIGGAIASTSMNWYVDLSGTAARSATATAVFAPGDVSMTFHDLRLVGSDTYGTTGETSINFFYGHDQPTIVNPADGVRYNIGSNAIFIGTPDTVAGIVTYWYRDYDSSYFGTGQNATWNALPAAARGYQKITYLATDSANFLSSHTRQILVNTPPTMTITQPLTSPAYYFGGQSINFAGYGENSSAPAGLLPAADLTWYKNGIQVEVGSLTYVGLAGDMGSITSTIALAGTDDLGTVGTRTITVETGLPLPKISSPASFTRFDTDANITFNANSLINKIDMYWYWVEGAVNIGSGPTTNIATLTPRGWHTISYGGIDSQGTAASDTMQVLVTKLATFTVLPYVSFPPQFATGPVAVGRAVPIHLTSAANYTLTLNTKAFAEDGSGPAIQPASLSWYLGAAFIGNGESLNYNFPTPGSYTIRVEARDDFNQAASISFAIWVWETEDYPTHVSSPAAIIAESETSILVADVDPVVNAVLRLTRVPDGLDIRGDLTGIAAQTDIASIAPYNLVDFNLIGGTMYTLETNADHRIQSWNSGTFASTGDPSYTYTQGPATTNFDFPMGIAIDSIAIYICDTGNDKVKKLDRSNGAFFIESQIATGPIGIRFSGIDNLYVAASVGNQMKRFKTDLNNDADWTANSINNATHFAFGPTSENIYVTDPIGAKINVIASSGALLYSFGAFGAGLGQFQQPYGLAIISAPGAYDMYVTDRTTGKIVRFRSNTW